MSGIRTDVQTVYDGWLDLSYTRYGGKGGGQEVFNNGNLSSCLAVDGAVVLIGHADTKPDPAQKID